MAISIVDNKIWVRSKIVIWSISLHIQASVSFTIYGSPGLVVMGDDSC